MAGRPDGYLVPKAATSRSCARSISEFSSLEQRRGYPAGP